MKKKMNHKRITETQRKELKAGWVAVKQVVVIVAPFLIADTIAAADLESGAPLPGWLWALEILVVACLLYTCTAKTLLLDMKGGVMVTIYPFQLRRWSKRIKLSSLMRGLFLFAPFMAVIRTMTRDPHTGFTLFASVYLGFSLFALMVTMARRRGRLR